MKTMKRRLAAIAAGAVTVGVIGTVPAYAINEVNIVRCTFESGYFGVRFQEPAATLAARRCFANAGEMNINQKYVNGFSSGNNAGWFIYAPGDGSEYRHCFPKNQVIYKYYGHIYELRINPPGTPCP
ncbi:beta/gamma crystallin domain-containing protein [Kribbella antibiotica]|nr:beta/gamma crystallin domain-containing protein [Kribbella antibiotica]